MMEKHLKEFRANLGKNQASWNTLSNFWRVFWKEPWKNEWNDPWKHSWWIQKKKIIVQKIKGDTYPWNISCKNLWRDLKSYPWWNNEGYPQSIFEEILGLVQGGILREYSKRIPGRINEKTWEESLKDSWVEFLRKSHNRISAEIFGACSKPISEKSGEQS